MKAAGKNINPNSTNLFNCWSSLELQNTRELWYAQATSGSNRLEVGGWGEATSPNTQASSPKYFLIAIKNDGIEKALLCQSTLMNRCAWIDAHFPGGKGPDPYLKSTSSLPFPPKIIRSYICTQIEHCTCY